MTMSDFCNFKPSAPPGFEPIIRRKKSNTKKSRDLQNLKDMQDITDLFSRNSPNISCNSVSSSGTSSPIFSSPSPSPPPSSYEHLEMDATAESVYNQYAACNNTHSLEELRGKLLIAHDKECDLLAQLENEIDEVETTLKFDKNGQASIPVFQRLSKDIRLRKKRREFLSIHLDVSEKRIAEIKAEIEEDREVIDHLFSLIDVTRREFNNEYYLDLDSRGSSPALSSDSGCSSPEPKAKMNPNAMVFEPSKSPVSDRSLLGRPPNSRPRMGRRATLPKMPFHSLVPCRPVPLNGVPIIGVPLVTSDKKVFALLPQTRNIPQFLTSVNLRKNI